MAAKGGSQFRIFHNSGPLCVASPAVSTAAHALTPHSPCPGRQQCYGHTSPPSAPWWTSTYPVTRACHTRLRTTTPEAERCPCVQCNGLASSLRLHFL